jgi:hypothetical protein
VDVKPHHRPHAPVACSVRPETRACSEFAIVTDTLVHGPKPPSHPARGTRAPQELPDLCCGAAVPATHPRQPSVAVAMGVSERVGGWLTALAGEDESRGPKGFSNRVGGRHGADLPHRIRRGGIPALRQT